MKAIDTAPKCGNSQEVEVPARGLIGWRLRRLAVLALAVGQFGQALAAEGGDSRPPVSKAVVRRVDGVARVQDGARWKPLNAGDELGEGATVRSAKQTQVEIELWIHGGVATLSPETTVTLKKLRTQSTPGGTVIDTALDLKEGKLSADVPAMIPTSKFEIFTTNGVVGVRGETRCQFDLASDLSLKAQQGQVVLVHPREDGQVQAYGMKRGEQYFPRTRTVGPRLD